MRWLSSLGCLGGVLVCCMGSAITLVSPADHAQARSMAQAKQWAARDRAQRIENQGHVEKYLGHDPASSRTQQAIDDRLGYSKE